MLLTQCVVVLSQLGFLQGWWCGETFHKLVLLHSCFLDYLHYLHTCSKAMEWMDG
jgi:hypothetical protein